MRAAVTSGRAEADPEGATPTAARQASTSRKSRILKAFFHILRVPWLSATRYTRRAPHGPSPSASPGRAAKWARSAAGATSATAAPAFARRRAGEFPGGPEEQRVGKEWCSPGSSRWPAFDKKK